MIGSDKNLLIILREAKQKRKEQTPRNLGTFRIVLVRARRICGPSPDSDIAVRLISFQDYRVFGQKLPLV